MKGYFYIEKDGKQIKCDILNCFSYNNDNFIIYNDGSFDNNGFLEVFANKFTMENEKITLLPIEDNEWNIIDKFWGDINE